MAGSGDYGGGPLWPASSPNVLAVGGTTLQVSTCGTYVGETAWSGSGGGISTIEQEPSYQASVQSTGRSTPDVAFDADPNTGVPIYSQASWLTIGGTSLGTAAWAGMIAIVDQGRALANEGTLGSTQTLTALYSLPSSAFHTVGGTYNTQTGLGSPNGAALVNDLVRQPPERGPPKRRPSSQPCALEGRFRNTISGHGSSRFRPVSLDPDGRAIPRPSRTRIENRPLSSNGTVT